MKFSSLDAEVVILTTSSFCFNDVIVSALAELLQLRF